MKPNLLIQIVLVGISLILLVVAVMLPKKTEVIPTRIAMDLNGETVVLTTTEGSSARAKQPREETSQPAAVVTESMDEAIPIESVAPIPGDETTIR